MDFRNINTRIIGLLRLHSLRESDGFSLLTLVRIESCDRSHSFLGMMDNWEGTVGIIFEFFHSHTASESATQFTRMVEEIRFALEVGHTAMVSKGTRIFQWHDFAHILPWSERLLAHGISDMLRHSTCSIKHIIVLATLHEPRSLCVAIFIFSGRITLLHIRRTESLLSHHDSAHFTLFINSCLSIYTPLEADHIFIQFGIVKMRITPIEISLTILIHPDSRVDIVPISIIEKRFAQRILERTGRRISHSYADSHSARQFRVRTDIPVILTITFDGLCCPGTVVCPRKRTEVERRTMVCPIHHILGGIHTPFVHPEEVSLIFVMTGIYIETVSDNQRCWVGS